MYCLCGCGAETTIFRGEARRFIAGHQARKSFNSRAGVAVSAETKEKISATRKLQGNPWWVGRKHSAESRAKMSASTKQFGSANPFYGKHHSLETKEKLRKNTLQMLSTGSFRKRPTAPEQVAARVLESLHIDFTTEYVIGDKFCVDIYIESTSTVIFVDGCYWHACPKHFPNSKHGSNDAAENAYLLKCGYRVTRIWEHDLKTNALAAIQKALAL